MIRKLENTDIDSVAEIWLDTNIKAHSFIPIQYWKDNFELVKGMFLQAEIYVYENEKQILGFIGVNNNYIEGIFVLGKAQSQGIGRLLLNYVKDRREKLQLNVYQKNIRAVHFYQREGFEMQGKSIDENTNEKEYLMVWNKHTISGV